MTTQNLGSQQKKKYQNKTKTQEKIINLELKIIKQQA
jgi:hypothetical protein